MEQPRHTHHFKFQNHKIRTIKREHKTWFITSDVCQALGIDFHDSLRHLKYPEINMIEGRDINDPTEWILSIVTEHGLDKLIHLAGTPESEEFARWIKTEVLPQIRLSDIDNQNPGITEDVLSRVQALHLKALGKSNFQAIMETMQVLRGEHPKEYGEALRYIDITHDFLFDNSMMQEGL